MAIDVSTAAGSLIVTILRTLHIVLGLVWVGAALLVTLYIEPTAEQSGAEGRDFLRALYRTTSFPRLIPASAIITTIAGLLLYAMLSYHEAMSNAMGIMITIGAAFGLLAFLHGIFAVWRPAGEFAGLLKAGAADEPSLTQLDDKIQRNGRISMWLALISLLLMAGARYAGPLFG